MPPEKITINSIVLLRAMAALGVCFVHIQMGTDLKVNALIDYIFMSGQQGVAVFFVISGFILPYSLYKKHYQLNGFFNFLLKRSVRVDPPYWFCIILLFILIPLPLSALSFKDILYHLTYAVPFINGAHWYNDIFWTLSIEFQFYILLGLLYPIFNKLPYYITISLLIIVSVLCIKYTYRGIIISNVYQFVFGYIAFMAYTHIVDRKKFIVILISFTIYILFAKSIVSAMIPAFTVLFIMLYKSNVKVPVVNFIGNISYSLYLVHFPVTVFVYRLLSAFTHSPVILFIACLLSAILFAYIFNIVIEKPALKLSKRISLHKSNEGH